MPDIEEIQDLVEKALIELGRANVAKAYILYRDRRAARARRCRCTSRRERRARRSRRARRGAHARAFRRAGARAASWRLINEAQLTREVAERVAARVEERVFAAGWKRVSTALVRELVDNELLIARTGERAAAPSLVRLAVLRPAQLLQSSEEAARSRAHGAGRDAQRAARRGARRRARCCGASRCTRCCPRRARARTSRASSTSIDVGRPHQALTCGVPSALVTGGGADSPAFDRSKSWPSSRATSRNGVVLEERDAAAQPLASTPRGARRSARGCAR
jgi:hypothetical protein